MASFEKAIPGLLKAEGGFAEADNTAGSVKWGITEKFLSDHRIDLDGDRDSDRSDVILVDKSIAADLYKRYFWDPLQLDKVNNQRLAELMFHIGVNQWIYWSAAHAQNAANQLGAKLVVDGNVGPKTLAALNSLDVDDLIIRYKAEALMRYALIARRWPEMYADDLPGWQNRLEKL